MCRCLGFSLEAENVTVTDGLFARSSSGTRATDFHERPDLIMELYIVYVISPTEINCLRAHEFNRGFDKFISTKESFYVLIWKGLGCRATRSGSIIHDVYFINNPKGTYLSNLI